MDIIIRRLLKNYGDRLVLNIDELEFKSGSIYGIIGSNGCGKTTLLRILGGLETEYRGEVRYKPEEGNFVEFKEIRNRTALLHQKPYLFDMSVIQNIEVGPKVSGKKVDVKNIDDMLDILNLNALRNKNGRNTSGGEGQKIALGRILVLEPELLLLDEPTANIDIDNTRTIEKAILSMRGNTSRTTIMITHNIFQAMRLCDYIIYMENGRVVEKVCKESALQSKRIKELFNYAGSI